MSALVCDICGGKLRMAEGGIAVCESCGVEHSLARMRQKYREVKGVVHVDNAHLVENYLALARDAYSAGNKSAAESYCNKIIEVDPENFEAYMLKGKAVGWQTTLGKSRFRGAAICFANAINCTLSEADKTAAEDDVEEQFRELASALISLRCESFLDSVSSEAAHEFSSDLDDISSAIKRYEANTGVLVDKNNAFGGIAALVKPTMSIIALKIILEYSIYDSKRAYEMLVEKTDGCMRIMQQTIDLCDDDSESDAQLYELMIEMTKALIERNTSDAVRNKWGAFVKTPRLTESELIERQKTISKIELKLARIKRR